MIKPWHTALVIPGLIIPCGAELGLTQSHENLLEAETYVTWNGIPEMRGPLGERDTHVQRIEIAVDHRWGPALRTLKLGMEVTLFSVEKEGGVIWPGQTFTDLDFFTVPVRSPQPRKPHGRELLAFVENTNDRVAVTVAGKRVSIAAPVDYPVTIQYRPIRPMRIEKFGGKTVTEIEGKQSWGLTLVDRLVDAEWTP